MSAGDENATDRAAGAPRDAVCFTAGIAGGAFGAGTIHAYLAADRPPPAVVAGISMGSLSAAAMQRCYRDVTRELHAGASAERVEAARWAWFRRYLTALWDRPLAPIWDGLPDQGDFFADRLPIRDPATPGCLTLDEIEALRQRYLLVKLGRWLAGLPVSVRTVTTAIVAWVRFKEGYSSSRPGRFVGLALSVTRLLGLVVGSIALRPSFVSERQFHVPGRSPKRSGVRPLFGWLIFLAAAALTASAFLVAGLLLLALAQSTAGAAPTFRLRVPAAVAGATALLGLGAVVAVRRRSVREYVLRQVLATLALSNGLIHDFHLRLRLRRLFEDDAAVVRDDPMPIVLVAAPLQAVTRPRAPDAPEGTTMPAYQAWFKPGADLYMALRTALALPGVWGPTALRGNAADVVSLEGDAPATLQLVDGSVIRQNPLPALFSFLKSHAPVASALADASREGRPAIHVVYTVPTTGSLASGGVMPDEATTIVDVGLASWSLSRRRDTQLEVQQTNFISRLEREIAAQAPASAPPRRTVSVVADEIAPERDLTIDNPLHPRRDEILRVTAEGCRRTLERLYAGELRALGGPAREAGCATLLTDVAPDRASGGFTTWPGLPEVCQACTRRLRAPGPADERRTSPADTLPPNTSELEVFPHLSGERPRIVFVASGGVFRGSFHIGMLGAFAAADIRPDLVVGASVGTLMGGALAALFQLSGPKRVKHLGALTAIFLKVDSRVALTRTLKHAVREVGIRGRSIPLSPRAVRRMLRRGSRSDPGYAAAGAPPALIDAMSDLFLIPHREMARITAEFVAGHVAEAVAEFLRQVRRETLHRLDIEYALIGSSLLEEAARELLGVPGADLRSRQPYLGPAPVAVFATSTNLGTQAPVLLGHLADHADRPCDFIEVALASSAFPCVFAPRRESDMYPGAGHPDLRFADGGMFDNLPFVPAVEVLARVQKQYRASKASTLSAREFLERRHKAPDLMIAGALNVNPEEDERGRRSFETPFEVAKRAMALQNNVKIRSFQRLSERVHRQVGRLLVAARPHNADSPSMDSIVDAAVLPVFPADADHLNPTFAFCAATGLRRERVLLSIADGCFQTFAALARGQARPDEPLASSLQRLGDRIPGVDARSAPGAKPGVCPHFRLAGRELRCPFFDAGAAGVHDQCRGDVKHLATVEKLGRVPDGGERERRA